MPSHVAGIIEHSSTTFESNTHECWERLATESLPEKPGRLSRPPETTYVSADIERLLSDLHLEYAVVTAHLEAAQQSPVD